MNDSQFDDFVNDRLKEYAAPVPAGLWEKVAEGQFDQFIGGKLRNHSAPVPEGLWDKIADRKFDTFIADKVDGAEAPVSPGLWNRIADGQFDSFVADKVKDHEPTVPAALWEKVRPEKDRDDRVAFWWFRYPAAAIWILALLTAAAWGGYMYFSQKNTGTSVSQNVAPLNSAAQPSSPTTRDADAASVPSSANDATGDTPGTGAIIPPADNINPADPSQENTAIRHHNGDLKNDRTALAAADKNVSVPFIAGGNNLNVAPPAKNNPITHNPPGLFPGKTAVIRNDDGFGSGGDGLAVYIEPYRNGFSEVATLSPYKLLINDLSNKQLSANARKFSSVIICPSDKGINRDWFLETYASGDVAFKSVGNVSASPLYMLKKDSSERSQIGYSAGIRLVKPITDNILLKAGIQYTQTNEKYVYRTENEVKTTTVVTVRTIIRAPGDTVIVQDTSILQTAGFKTNTVRNRYRSFDVPVTIGYQFGNEDLKFGINAGIVVNLTSWYQGMVLDSTLANVPLNTSGNGIYKTHIGLGLTAGISVVKRLSDDLHVFAEPYFRYNLSDMTTPQAGFSQRLSLGGLAVGLRFNLNRK